MASSETGSSRGDPHSLFSKVDEKKHNLRRIASEVGVMASELQSARNRVAAQEAALQEEIFKRETAEANVRDMERQLDQLSKSLDDRKSHAHKSALAAEQYLNELIEVWEKLTIVELRAQTSAETATSVQLQCASLLRELDLKKVELQEKEKHVAVLEQHIKDLQEDLDINQKQVNNEAPDAEAHSIIGKSYISKECEFRKLLNEISTRNFHQLEKQVLVKDEEIARLRQELKVMSAELRLKTLDLEAQVEKQLKTEEELNKSILKLEFWLQEARSQTRKLKKIAEKREEEIQQLRAQIWLQDSAAASSPKGSSNYWESFRLPTLLSMAVLTLVCMVKR